MAKAKTESIGAVRDSLIAQLKNRGADISVYNDLVDQYITNLQIIRDMKKDIKKRGLSFNTVSSTGKEYEKENPSVKALIMYQKTGIALLQAMNLSTEKCMNPEDDEL